MVRIVVPEPPAMVLVPMETVGPVGDIVAVMVTVRVKPCAEATVIVRDADPPATIVRDVGFVESVKSGVKVVTVRIAECDRDPLDPVTFTK